MLKLRMSQWTAIASAVLIVMIGATAVLGVTGFNRTKIGSKSYENIISGKDLIADILPPPMFAVEALLAAHLAESHPEKAREYYRTFKKLNADFTDRIHFWAAADIPADVAAKINSILSKTDQFWNVGIETFFPALLSGNVSKSKEALRELDKAFELHRATINDTVEFANAFTQRNEAEAATTIAQTSILLLISGALLLLTILACGFAVVCGVTRPLGRAVETVAQLTSHQLEVTIPAQHRRDEIGDLARGLETFRLGLLESDRLQAEREMVERRNAERLIEERLAIAERFETSMGKLAAQFVATSNEVQMAAQSLSAAAEQTTRQAQTVTAAAADSLSNVQTVASASEELATSVQEICGKVSHSSEVATQAATHASQTDENIQKLMRSAAGIGQVIELIKAIAAQTNLLALNATIEAARAGEAGRGFSIVAAEVKELAAQTAKATDDIHVKITEIQSATTLTVDSIAKISSTIDDVQSISTAVASAVEQQGGATREIAQNTHRVARRTEEVTQNIAGVSHAASNTGAASEQLMALSQSLSVQAHQLKDEVGDFILGLRAA